MGRILLCPHRRTWLGLLQAATAGRDKRNTAPPRNAMVLWLEYFAGHFATVDGEYPPMLVGKPKTTYRKPATTYREVMNDRAGEGRCVSLRNVTAAREHPMRQRGNAAARSLGVPVLSVFGLSAPMSDDHPANGNARSDSADCRHWCFPGPVLESRCQVLYQGLSSADTTLGAAHAMNRWAARFKQERERKGATALAAFRARAQQLHGFGHNALPTVNVPKTSPVLYIFSGMDIATALSFFPHAAEFVLIAEWEPGDVTCFKYSDCANVATTSAKSMITALTENPNYQSSRLQKSTFEMQVNRRDVDGQPQPGTRPIGVLPSMVGFLALAGHSFVAAERLKPPLNGIALTTIEGARFVYVSSWISSNTTRALEQVNAPFPDPP